MELTKGASYVFLVCAILIVPLIILINVGLAYKKTRKRQGNVDSVKNNSPMSKDNTLCLRGLAAIAIMFHHYCQKLLLPDNGVFRLLPIYGMAGYISVGIFLLISGYTTAIQYENKKICFDANYLIKRLLRLYIPYFTIITAFSLCTRQTFGTYLWKILTFDARVDNGQPNAVWFMIVILYLNISCYFAFKLKTKTRKMICMLVFIIIWIAGCVLIGVGTWWYLSVGCFYLGLLLAFTADRCKSILQKGNRLLIFSFISFFVMMALLLISRKIDIPLIQIPTALSVCVFIYLMTYSCELSSRLLKMLGSISLELFLVHVDVLNMAFAVFEHNSITMLFVILFSVVVAFLFYKMDNLLIGFINKSLSDKRKVL